MSLLGIKLHNLFYLGLSWSHDPGRGFERLTRVKYVIVSIYI